MKFFLLVDFECIYMTIYCVDVSKYGNGSYSYCKARYCRNKQIKRAFWCLPSVGMKHDALLVNKDTYSMLLLALYIHQANDVSIV